MADTFGHEQAAGESLRTELPRQESLRALFHCTRGVAETFDDVNGNWEGMTSVADTNGSVWVDVKTFPSQQRDEHGKAHMASFTVVAEGMASDGSAARRTHELWLSDSDAEPAFELRGALSKYTEDDVRKFLGFFGVSDVASALGQSTRILK